MSAQGLPEIRNGCPVPPYNTLNFNSNSPVIFSTLQSFAQTSPNYPLPVGSNARLVAENQANVAYFNAINQQTINIRSSVQSGIVNLPYPQFKSEGERMKYIQGKATTAARSILVPNQNPVGTAGVPLSTIYQIINS
jgi:hypothetical protein